MPRLLLMNNWTFFYGIHPEGIIVVISSKNHFLKRYFFLQPDAKFFHEAIIRSLRTFSFSIIETKKYLLTRLSCDFVTICLKVLFRESRTRFFSQMCGIFMKFHNHFMQGHTCDWSMRHGHNTAIRNEKLKNTRN